MFTGMIGLLVFVADIYAIVTVLKSKVTGGAKFLWCFLIVILPVLGLIIWFFAGPKN